MRKRLETHLLGQAWCSRYALVLGNAIGNVCYMINFINLDGD